MKASILRRLADLIAVAEQARKTIEALPENTAAALLVCHLAIVVGESASAIAQLLAIINAAASNPDA